MIRPSSVPPGVHTYAVESDGLPVPSLMGAVVIDRAGEGGGSHSPADVMILQYVSDTGTEVRATAARDSQELLGALMIRGAVVIDRTTRPL
jgi:hypothetical protein